MWTNRGFTRVITRTTGSCQRSELSAAQMPRAHPAYANPPANYIATKTGCIENMVRASVIVMNTAGTTGCMASNAVCRTA